MKRITFASVALSLLAMSLAVGEVQAPSLWHARPIKWG